MHNHYIDLHMKDADRVDVDTTVEVHGNDASKLTNTDLGMRLLRVGVLAVCYFVVELIAKVLVVSQLLYTVWQRRPHPGMQRLGTSIADYMRDLWKYCTFASDNAPWPFRR